MEVVHPRCCGIDVHQASLAVCVAIKEEGKSEKYKLRCGTTSAELLRLADWLHGYQVTQVAMEATGVYWKRYRCEKSVAHTQRNARSKGRLRS